MEQEILTTHHAADALNRLCTAAYDRVFLLADETSEALCRPLLADWQRGSAAQDIVIKPGDDNKSLEALTGVWEALQKGGASRHSLLVCLGGGMVTDLGGFAAATFKRGMDFVNVPTTLLAMVDAAVGGKTGINFGGYKNEIGAFREARAVVIDTSFLRTLDAPNLRSGYAEMLKHSLLSDERMWAAHVGFNLAEPDWAQLRHLVAESIDVKRRVVAADPTERGLRKALNLGHTFGHALESLALLRGRPLLHGYFVAWGLICELWLSATQLGFPTAQMRQTVRFIREYYGRFPFTCDDYPQLLSLMRHDKKNTGGVISVTLLGGIGDIRIDRHPTDAEIQDALDFLREGA